MHSVLENNEENVNLYGEYAINNGLDPAYLGNQKLNSNFNPFDLITKNVQDNTHLEEIIEILFDEFKLAEKTTYIPILVDVGIFRRLLKVSFVIFRLHSS